MVHLVYGLTCHAFDQSEQGMHANFKGGGGFVLFFAKKNCVKFGGRKE